MKLHKENNKEALRRVEQILAALIHGHDDTVQLNIHDGLLGFDTPYRVSLTKQMTLDYYTQTDSSSLCDTTNTTFGSQAHFLVLDVLVNTRYLFPSYAMISSRTGGPNMDIRLTTPEDLALRIYHSYKHKRSGE